MLSDNPDKQALVSKQLATERQRFLKFIVSRVGDTILAEDLLQESFLRCLNTSRLPEDEDKIPAWFYQVIKNVVNDYFRQQSKDRKKISAYGEEASHSTEALTETLQCACDLFFWPALSKAHQEILQQVDLAGKPLKDYAIENNMSYGAARVARHRARKSLGKAILKMCECFGQGYDNCPCPAP